MQIMTNPTPAALLTAAQPADSGGTNGADSGSSDGNSATITANDFLQLLVTEMQNQDPTADTDPNEYIDQLVQVNSLEQLISINQELGSVTGSSSASGAAAGAATTSATSAVGAAPGNLSSGDTGPAASRIAAALSAATQTLAPGAAESPLSSAIQSLRSRAQAARSQFLNPAH
jgi:flagellar basal-body rod modification protein FlgD